MINSQGVMAVLDHHVTINWDDGPTLMRIAGQVRYHTGDSPTVQTLRVTASRRSSEEPLCFYSANADLHATWTVQPRGDGWTFQLSVTNAQAADDLEVDNTQIYLDTLDVIRIDSGFGGVLSLGAPTGLWQCSSEHLLLGAAAQPDAQSDTQSDTQPASDQWAAGSPTANGFVRQRELIVQPSASNRTRPPALMIRALEAEALQTELQLELDGEKFERFVAREKLEGTLIGGGVTVASPEFWVLVGDDMSELKQTVAE